MVVVGMRVERGYFQVYISPPTPKMSIFSLYSHINIQGKILIGFLGSGTQRLGQSLCPGVGLSTVIDRLIGILWNVGRKDREAGAGCYPQRG